MPHSTTTPEPCPVHPDSTPILKVVRRISSGQSDHPVDAIEEWRCSVRGCRNSR